MLASGAGTVADDVSNATRRGYYVFCLSKKHLSFFPSSNAREFTPYNGKHVRTAAIACDALRRVLDFVTVEVGGSYDRVFASSMTFRRMI
jgi:hypothetical protein